MKYNKAEIMTEAWDLFRRMVRRTFGEALKLAWENAKRIKRTNKKVIVKKNIEIKEVAAWVLRKMDTEIFMALESGIAVNDITLEKETEKAIQVSTEWNGLRKMIWLPKSACLYA